MKVSELIAELEKVKNKDKEIHITSMGGSFCEIDITLQTDYDDNDYIELIMNNYVEL